MPDFKFDPTKTFDENVDAFKDHVSAIDPECATILFDELDALLGDGDPAAAKVRGRRAEFNTLVAVALDALLAKDSGTS